jgi:hypothetical protein
LIDLQERGGRFCLVPVKFGSDHGRNGTTSTTHLMARENLLDLSLRHADPCKGFDSIDRENEQQ